MATAGEKLKNFGLRFGDKIAVLLAAGLFALCLFKALTRETIDVQPEQIKKAAEQSDSNLRRKVPTEEIVQTLVDGGIKQSDFAKEAETSSKMVLAASDFQARREWVTPEPGAGLIRDQPNLIAPENVFAYPSRGGALVYALDSEGNRIVETETKEPPKSNIFRSRKRRGGMMMGSDMGMGGMMGPGMGMGGQPNPDQEKQAKAEFERKKREMMAKLAGPSGPKKEKPEDANKPQGPPPKEVTKGLRWVAITATLNHEQMLENYRQALKNSAIAQPHYRRLDVQRQTKQQDGTWTDWADVDAERNLTVLDNLPMEDEELTPDNVRPTDLNDPLPFLTAGLWEKVHIASLVPDEVKNIPDPTKNPAMMGGMGGMMMGPGMEGSSMMPGMDGGMMNSGMMGGRGGMMNMMMMGEGSGMMGMDGMGMGMGMGMGGTETLDNFWRSEEKTVMVRALDFTAQPDESYRYRVRIVVFNPNFNREDVAPGVDAKSEELQGPWSESTDEVHMPPDVTAYAMGVLQATPKSEMKGVFQIVKFNPDDGQTLPRQFEAAPGELLGEVRTTQIPTSDGTGTKNKGVDFSSQLMVLDVVGGFKPLPAGFLGNIIVQPSCAALLRPDGLVELHDEADDRSNEVRKDVESNYKRELKESDKVRSSSMGSGYDMMGGMMGSGMMGPGMMGGSR
ncbi:hypothetical protein [Paludisphaera rhizosphaerae]|uniref:hypothetical protein n=1 Tax=Paludisphaera rhizosphaerae TaxID=2711216 RepID=UPI0013ECB89E|nr:hypothetical protein [Paludisphaera rhizosphaerae]